MALDAFLLERKGGKSSSPRVPKRKPQRADSEGGKTPTLIVKSKPFRKVYAGKEGRDANRQENEEGPAACGGEKRKIRGWEGDSLLFGKGKDHFPLPRGEKREKTTSQLRH